MLTLSALYAVRSAIVAIYIEGCVYSTKLKENGAELIHLRT